MSPRWVLTALAVGLAAGFVFAFAPGWALLLTAVVLAAAIAPYAYRDALRKRKHPQ